MTEKQKTFENDKVSVLVDFRPGCEVELAITVKPEACKEAEVEAFKRVRQHVSLPGFRKGKAPEPMIRKTYAKAIEEQFEDLVVDYGVRHALALTELFPWKNEDLPRPEVKTIALEGVEMALTFEREPEVPTLTADDVKLSKGEVKAVTDEQVEEEIATLRKENASYEETDGAVEPMGHCRIDLESLKDDPPSKILTDHQVQVDDEKIAGWLIDLIVGKKAGESAEGMTSPPKEATEEEKEKFEPMEVRATVKAVLVETPPTDEALTEIMRVDSMDELNERVRHQLEHKESQRVDNELCDALWQMLLESYPFELPRSLVESELRSTLRRKVEEMRRQGLSADDIQAKEKEIEAEAKAEVEKKLHRLFLARKVVFDADVQPTDDEVNDCTQQMILWESLSQGRMIDPSKLPPEQLAAYRSHAFVTVVQEKAEDHLLAGVRGEG